jgi:hypothetical protein
MNGQTSEPANSVTAYIDHVPVRLRKFHIGRRKECKLPESVSLELDDPTQLVEICLRSETPGVPYPDRTVRVSFDEFLDALIPLTSPEGGKPRYADLLLLVQDMAKAVCIRGYAGPSLEELAAKGLEMLQGGRRG